MLGNLLDRSARQTAAAYEQARRLEGAIARTANVADAARHTSATLTRLADAWGRQEAVAVGDLQAAKAAISTARDLLASGAIGSDAARVMRSARAIGANIDRAGAIAVKIKQGAASIANGAHAAMGAIGGAFGAAVDVTRETFSAVRQSVTAIFAPPAAVVPVHAESTALSLRTAAASNMPGASAAHAHLLILTSAAGDSFYFNLSTAGFDTLRRQTSYNVAAQERLTRRPALQAVSKGGESITVSGAIFTGRAGAGQLDQLRGIGFAMAPLMLTTGYGHALGQWYLTRIEEEQAGLFADGMPRKQQFTLEFQRYGEDYSNL